MEMRLFDFFCDVSIFWAFLQNTSKTMFEMGAVWLLYFVTRGKNTGVDRSLRAWTDRYGRAMIEGTQSLPLLIEIRSFEYNYVDF